MRTFAGILLMLTLAAPVSAQERDTTLAPVLADTAAPVHRMVTAGVLGGAIGLFLGGAVGAGLETTLSRNCTDFCGLGGAVLGAVVGETLGLAYGVHAGNRRRGSFSAAVAGPMAVTVGTIALTSLFSDEITDGVGMAIVVAVPVAQLVTSIQGELRAAEAR